MTKHIPAAQHKTDLVKRLIWPIFGLETGINKHKAQDIIDRFRLQNATKYQELEVPGPAIEGRLWIAVQAMAHCYYYQEENGLKCGTEIWQKGQVIFCPSSLLADEPRTTYIAMLEQSETLSIVYAELLDLMNRYPNIDAAIQSHVLKREYYSHRRNLLLNQRPLERVRQFRAENQAFLNCSSQEVQAMHLNMSLRSYIDQINKLK